MPIHLKFRTQRTSQKKQLLKRLFANTIPISYVFRWQIGLFSILIFNEPHLEPGSPFPFKREGLKVLYSREFCKMAALAAGVFAS